MEEIMFCPITNKECDQDLYCIKTKMFFLNRECEVIGCAKINKSDIFMINGENWLKIENVGNK